MINLLVQIDGEFQSVDLIGDETVSLTINAEDLTDISNQLANFSKEITLPGTRHNNKLFGFSNSINSINFDTTQLYNAKVLDKSVEVFSGVIEFNSAQRDGNGIWYYQANLFSQARSLKDIVQDKGLDRLSFPIQPATVEQGPFPLRGTPEPYLEEKHYLDYLRGNIRDDDIEVIVNTGHVYRANTGFHDTFTRHFQIVHNVKSIWDKIFESTGFSYESDFLNSDRFKQLYLLAPNATDPADLKDEVYRSEINQDFLISKNNYLNPPNYPDLYNSVPGFSINGIKIAGEKYDNTADDFKRIFGYKQNNVFILNNQNYESADENKIKNYISETIINSEVIKDKRPRWEVFDYKKYNDNTFREAREVRNSGDENLLREQVNMLKINKAGTYTVKLDAAIKVFADTTNPGGPGNVYFRVIQTNKSRGQVVNVGASNAPDYKLHFRYDQPEFGDNTKTWEKAQPDQAEEVASTAKVQGSGAGTNYNLSINKQLDLDVDDILIFELVDGAGTGFTQTPENEILVKQGTTWTLEQDNSYRLTQIDDAARLLPSNFTQKEFIDNIINMFNLRIQPLGNNRLKIEPYADFYANPEIKDWSRKIDLNSSMQLQFQNDVPKEFVFKFADDEQDYYHQQYKNRKGDRLNFGSRKVDNPNNDTAEGTSLEVSFAQQPVAKTPDNSFMLPYIAYVDGEINFPYPIREDPKSKVVDTDSKLRGSDFTPRIMFLNEKVELDNPVKYNFTSNYSYRLNNDGITLGSHLDDLKNPTFDLTFGLPASYYQGDTSRPDKNLFSEYHKPALDDRLGKDAVVLTAKFNLSDIDIAQFSNNDQIFALNAYWRVLEIKDYEVGADTLTEVKLIKVTGFSLNEEIDDDYDGRDNPVIPDPSYPDPGVPGLIDPPISEPPDDPPTGEDKVIDSCNYTISGISADSTYEINDDSQCEGTEVTVDLSTENNTLDDVNLDFYNNTSENGKDLVIQLNKKICGTENQTSVVLVPGEEATLRYDAENDCFELVTDASTG